MQALAQVVQARAAVQVAQEPMLGRVLVEELVAARAVLEPELELVRGPEPVQALAQALVQIQS